MRWRRRRPQNSASPNGQVGRIMKCQPWPQAIFYMLMESWPMLRLFDKKSLKTLPSGIAVLNSRRDTTFRSIGKSTRDFRNKYWCASEIRPSHFWWPQSTGTERAVENTEIIYLPETRKLSNRTGGRMPKQEKIVYKEHSR